VSRSRLFGSLCAIVFLVNFARVVFAPLIGEFISEFAIGEGTAGLIVTLAWVGSAAPRPRAGRSRASPGSTWFSSPERC